jgi:hypothetical protein
VVYPNRKSEEIYSIINPNPNPLPIPTQLSDSKLKDSKARLLWGISGIILFCSPRVF